jgi:hypothetical protein
MSSTNKTSLGLNMWEASDKPVRQDFVNDNVIINEKITKLNSDLIKVYIGEQVTTSLAPETDGMITLTNVGPGTVKAIIPLGFTPVSSWGTEVIFKGANITNNSISIRIAQRVSGAASQTFTIRYLVLYT